MSFRGSVAGRVAGSTEGAVKPLDRGAVKILSVEA
jgi:hypothetical protein